MALLGHTLAQQKISFLIKIYQIVSPFQTARKISTIIVVSLY